MFWGHSDFPIELSPYVKDSIINTIENENVNNFYVGNQGSFDFCVIKTLEDIKKIYPHISYNVVLAYLPRETEKENICMDFSNTIMFDRFETIPRRFAIYHRNLWMLNNSDYVICYITDFHRSGGAVEFVNKAIRKNKICINIANLKIK